MGRRHNGTSQSPMGDPVVSGSPRKNGNPSGSRGGSLVGVDYARGARAAVAPAMLSGGRPARLYLIGFIAALWVIGLVWRMYSLQVSHVATWRDWAIRQHVAEMQVASERGPIVDRNGKLMAVSVPTGSVYVRPRQVADSAAVVKELAAILEISPSHVTDRLSSKQPFVWVKRQVPRYMADRIQALELSGVGVTMESRRFYPYNQASSALIGKVGVDGIGLSGVESLFERRLHVEHTTTKATRDAFGNLIHVTADGNESSFEVPKGSELRLSIDADLQIIMDEELEIGRKEANAKHAMAVLIDSHTGEIVAMSQSPSYNFNLSSATEHKDALKNLLVEAVFEPGSIMKPIVAAAALDAKVVGANELINCENGRYRYSTHTIKDVHGAGIIPFHEVIARSSNIGMTKVGIRLGDDRLHRYLKAFGFGVSTELGLPGESVGILRPVSRWAKIDVATHSFGQGVAVTPLQMVRAVAAIANGGVLPKLSVVVDDIPPAGERIVSERAALLARDMMYEVVESSHGTGKKARIEGLRVGGKTGTAQKANPKGGGYMSGAYVASFVGFADGSPVGVDRSFTAMVVIDEPRAKSIYGGTLAAPVFSKVLDRSFRFLSTRTKLGLTPRLLPRAAEASPEVSVGVHGPESLSREALVPAKFDRR